jgi:hypothetical protein
MNFKIERQLARFGFRSNLQIRSLLLALGGALDSHDLRRVVWLRKNFSPGRYVLHYEMPVESGASPQSANLTHADLGMVHEFKIEK